MLKFCLIINKLYFVKFEDSYYPAPCNPDGYLRAIYGDYMTLPPAEARITHENTAYTIGETDESE